MAAETQDSHLENISKDLVQSLAEGGLSWEWDNRFNTALTAFSVSKQELVHQAVSKSLDTILDASSIETASEAVKNVSKSLGGVSPGQQLLISDPESGSFLYCAWWPWGNGESISIRIAPVFIGDDGTKQALLSRFKEIFCVE
ncbi:hypothetical protein H0A36_00165 [Endozoicomonas sp. SM1973]|uniref:Uncharacterized protein n=1 Tax=Spartinivicinus marinus TaxID=2994442 RepID=A0A853HVF9_9GAMM|nr:hypothetical protein [Spartinivicinus marinus]MCX4026562.1 hypothetical protein [Spartinivicinus marinus]NYZ64399.1 hypothetical protein [Spartinivicinus marinus]